MHRSMDWFRSWRLVSWRTGVAVAIAVYGLVGFLLVPVVAKKLIVEIAHERTGREVTVGEVRCNPFTLSLTIRDFSMSDRPGTTLVSFDEFYANVQASSLFRWAATLKEFRMENPYVGIRRFPDGGINVLELMDDIKERTPPSDEPGEKGGLPRALMQHILARGAAMDVEDHARDEPLVWRFGPSKLELNNISTIPELEGDNDFVIALQGGGSVGVTGDVVVEPLGLGGTVEIDRIYLEAAWEALQPFFDFDVVDGVAGGAFSYSVFLDEDGPHAMIGDADFFVQDIEVTAGSSRETVLRVGSVTTSDVSAAWPEARVRGSSIVVEGAEAFQWIRSDGTPSWDKLVPKETQERTVEIYRKVEAAFPWDIALDRFEIRSAAARIEDRTFPEPLQIVVDEADLQLTDIATGPDHQWGLTASARLLREGAAKADGFVGTRPMRIEAEVGLENIQLPRVQPYLERIAPIQLRSGTLETNGTAKASTGGVEPAASFAGDLTIHDFDVGESVLGTTLLQWEGVEVRGIDAGVAPMSVEIDSIQVFDANVEIVLSEEGKTNLLEVLAAMSEEAEVGEEPEEAEEVEEPGLPPVTVRAITLVACSGSVTERSVNPAFTLSVDPVDGTIEGVSTIETAGAGLDLEGSVQTGGMVSVEGEMDLLDPKRLTDLEIDVRQADLPPLSPMSVRYIGHPIEEGSADLGFHYEIVDSDLLGDNRFVTDGLVLGDKVEGEAKVNLPFKLGVSLLTDKEGLITLEFPIEGSLDDPAFLLASAVGSATTELVSEAIESPFRVLGRLGGGSGDEDLGFVEFAAGSAELEKTATDRLSLLAAGSAERPELVLVVQGAWDPAVDAAGLKEIAFEARLGDQQASVALLESMVRETEPTEAIDALRAQHMVIDEETGARVLDETAYYRDLRAGLIEGQVVDASEVQALARARAEAIRAFMVEDHGIDPARVRIIEPVAVENPSGDAWVRCRLDVDIAG